MTQLEHLKERNSKIIDAVVKKAERVCPGALALIGVYGSFLTGDSHDKSDLDLLILINDDRGWQLGCTFIQEDDQVGHDIYCTNWDGLINDAGYEHPNIAKLMDSKIVYCADHKYLEKLEELRSQVKEKLAAKLTAEAFDKAFEAMGEAAEYLETALHAGNRSEVWAGAGGVLYFLENAVAMLNQRYFQKGVKRAYEELSGMEKRPEKLCKLIEDVISSHTPDEVKTRLVILMQETMKTFAVEGAEFGKIIGIQSGQDEAEAEYSGKTSGEAETENSKPEPREPKAEMANPSQEETEAGCSKPGQDEPEEESHGCRKQPTAEALVGTYEEMFSNWRNKMYLAAETGNRHLAFMSLISFYSMLSEIAGEWEIGDYDPLSGYDPDDLYATAQAFDDLLDSYLEEYEKVGLTVKCFANIDAYISDYLNKAE